MEATFIWLGVGGLFCLSLLIYVRQFRNRRSADLERLIQNRELGMDRPTGQYPLIDAAACIGCGTCVSACPEHDVLGIVMGRSVVINGARCIGHGKCAEACPVGAIRIGLGDITKRDDIPVLSAEGQTNLPGLWIAGELSGFALINNAVAQGRKVIEAIAATGGPREVGPSEVFDVVVVGAGPAGMSAGLVAGELGLSCVILDQQGAGGTILQYPRRKLVMVQCDPPLDSASVRLNRNHQVLDAYVREGAAHHHIMIAATGTITVEIGYGDVVLQKIDSRR